MSLKLYSRSHVITALLLIGALLPLLPLQSQAGQASGQLGVSLTIVDSCQVNAAGSNSPALSLSNSQCAQAASYRVMYEAQDQQVDNGASAQSITQVQNPGDEPTRVTLYW